MIDISVLPKRPSFGEIKTFLEDELQLDMSVVKTVQPHNVKNIVYISFLSEDVATRIASSHHSKHHMVCEGKRSTIPLPIYVESSAIDVRLHDLPEEMDNLVIVNHMRQYGEVIGIRSEVWRDFFPGLSNGVRVVRMKIEKPIPSYITVDQEITMVSHLNQIRTCKHCDRKSHPKQRCTEIVAAEKQRIISKTAIPATKQNSVEQPLAVNEKEWPHLSKPTTANDDKGTSKPSALNRKSETKRQLSHDSDTDKQVTKKTPPAPQTSSGSESSVTTVPETAPYGYRTWRRNSFSFIEDEKLRQEYIDEESRRIEEIIRQQNMM